MFVRQPVDAFAGLLAALQDSGSMPWGRVSGKSKGRLRPLLDAGVLIELRAGAGRAVKVENHETLSRFIAMHYPAGLFVCTEDEEGIDRRAVSLARYRNSKAMGGLDMEIVEYRLAGTAPIQIGTVSRRASDLVPAGLGAFVLHDLRPDEFPLPHFAGRVATVENPTVFLSYPWQANNIDMAILTYGRMSKRLIGWLAGSSMAAVTVTHYGDYDPVGLCEFMRLHERLEDRAELFVPENIEALFKQFSDRELLTRSAALLPRLESSKHIDVQRILSIMRNECGGLEHEVLVARCQQVVARQERRCEKS